MKDASRPVGLKRASAGLGTSNGCQDHTASPSATAPFVCAPVNRSRQNRPANAKARRRCRVHRIPALRFVTTRTPLSSGGTSESINLFLPNREAIYFLREDWTGFRGNSLSGKSLGLHVLFIWLEWQTHKLAPVTAACTAYAKHYQLVH
jgi:hypothetical protein